MRRILAKTMSYGVMHLLVTFCISWFVSGSLHIALAISMLEPAVQIFFFSVHEYFWTKHNPGQPNPHRGCCSAVVDFSKIIDFIGKK